MKSEREGKYTSTSKFVDGSSGARVVHTDLSNYNSVLLLRHYNPTFRRTNPIKLLYIHGLRLFSMVSRLSSIHSLRHLEKLHSSRSLLRITELHVV